LAYLGTNEPKEQFEKLAARWEFYTNCCF